MFGKNVYYLIVLLYDIFYEKIIIFFTVIFIGLLIYGFSILCLTKKGIYHSKSIRNILLTFSTIFLLSPIHNAETLLT